METIWKIAIIIIVAILTIAIGLTANFLMTHHTLDHSDTVKVLSHREHFYTTMMVISHGKYGCSVIPIFHHDYLITIEKYGEINVGSTVYNQYHDGDLYSYHWTTWEENKPSQ